MAARRAQIPMSDAIMLWSRAGSRCSFPGCGRELIWGRDEPRIRGEMAHIVASSDIGPRGDPDFPPSGRNRYSNLLLLCPNHHEEIDAEVAAYGVEVLRAMKSSHEQWVAGQLSKGASWWESLSTTDYINVPRVLLDPASAGLLDEKVLTRLSELETLRGLGFELNRITVALEQVMGAWSAHAIDLREVGQSGEENIGARVAFETRFRTKNMTGSDKQRPDFELTGELENDPHIYVKVGTRKIYLPLDPRWVTTSTAFTTFTSGSATLAGIGQLRAVDDDIAIVSPLAIGGPPFRGVEKEMDDLLSTFSTVERPNTALG
jgi:hypothetical protein